MRIPKSNLRGIAHVGAELFTVINDRATCFNIHTYAQTREIIVPGMKQATSLAACKQNNCLYIGETDAKCIHRVVLSNSSCSKWSLNADPRQVSLTKAFNLLVTLPQTIEEYTSAGNLVRYIKLDSSLENPRHAIELSSGQFVICHAGDAQHRVLHSRHQWKHCSLLW